MSNSLGFVVSLAEMEQFYRGGKAGQIIELMNKTNDIMDDVLWMESNQSDGHLTRIRTGLPEVYWRRLYQGTPPSKSQWSQVKEGCGILEAIMELDVEELRLYGSRDKSFRMSEGVAFAGAEQVDATLLTDPSEMDLIRMLAAFPQEIVMAAEKYDPSRINRFVIDLASAFHRFYGNCRIQGADPAVQQARLALCIGVKNVIFNVLTMFKINVPEKM